VLICPYMCFISSIACLFIAFDYISCVSLLCIVINHQKGGDGNEHGTIYVISSDFGHRMTTQSMGLMVLLSELF